jgi:hypothetical protein
MKVTPSDRDSGLGARRFEEMVRSDEFSAFLTRVMAEMERARLVCERAEEDTDLRRAQGAVAALRTVLGLPLMLLEELKSGKVANK